MSVKYWNRMSASKMFDGVICTLGDGAEDGFRCALDLRKHRVSVGNGSKVDFPACLLVIGLRMTRSFAASPRAKYMFRRGLA